MLILDLTDGIDSVSEATILANTWMQSSAYLTY